MYYACIGQIEEQLKSRRLSPGALLVELVVNDPLSDDWRLPEMVDSERACFMDGVGSSSSHQSGADVDELAAI
jgi:hypothetical protein